MLHAVRTTANEISFLGSSSRAPLLDSLLHGVLLFPGHLLAQDDPCLDEEEDARHVLEDDADEAQAERPGEVVVFPVGHEVPAVAHGAEDDEREGAEDAGDDEVDARPPQHANPVVLVDAEQVHRDEDDGDQHPDEAQREEELRGHEERWKEIAHLAKLANGNRAPQAVPNIGGNLQASCLLSALTSASYVARESS